jgi:putative PIG3 family NAD(P)H quinone oxidoreductase
LRAAVITRPGEPDVLELREVPDPEPGHGEVRVRVRASALNRADTLQRVGRYPAPAGVPRDIPGIEFAGEVDEVGTGVERWRRGDRVFAIVGGGAHAEYVIAPQHTLVRIPDALDWPEAGAAPEAFMTAHDAAVTQAGLIAGESVLIHAVGSGVGLAATSLVRALGGVPYGTSRTADKIERARPLGLEDGVVVDRELEPMVLAASRWTQGRGFEIVLDLLGGAYVPASVEALGLKGRLMLIGTVAGPRATIEVGRILAKRLTIRGTVLRARSLPEKTAVADAFARDVVPLLERKAVVPVIDSVFPLARIADAHRRMESNASFGKVVLVM